MAAGGCTSLLEPVEEAANLVRPGPYASIAGAYAIEDFDLKDAERALESELGEDVNVTVDDSLGVDARVGYRFEGNVALEGSFQWYDEFDTEIDGSEVLRFDGHSASVNLKGYLPVDRWFHPYGLVGFGWIWARARDSLGLGLSDRDRDSMIRVGGGLEVNLDETWSLQFEGTYNRPLDDLEDFRWILVTAGLQMRF